MITKKVFIFIFVSLAIIVGIGFYSSSPKDPTAVNTSKGLVVLGQDNNPIKLDSLDPKKSRRDEYIASLLKLEKVPEGYYKFGKSDSRGDLFLTIGLLNVGEFAMLLKVVDKQTMRILWELHSDFIFRLPVKTAELVDLDGDGYLDIYLQTLTANYLEIERPWLFLYHDGSYHLATALIPDDADPMRALSEKNYAANAMEIRMHIGDSVWLRDLDGDKTLEVITLDQGHFAEQGETITEFTKRIYKLENDVYVLQSKKQIFRDSEEDKEIMSWPTTPINP